MKTADIKTLEKLAERMLADCQRGNGMSATAIMSIAAIIEDAIGAPLSWPSREAGAKHADDAYPGDNAMRAAFNAGVKWAVENYQPTVEPTRRYGE